MSKRIQIEDAVQGHVHLAFLGNARLPSYKIVAKRKNGKWYYEGDDVPMNKDLITDLWTMPLPEPPKE